MPVTRTGWTTEEIEGRVDWSRVLELHPDGVVILDANARCTFANAAALRILGVRRRDLEQRGLDHPEWRARRLDGRPLGADDTPAATALRGGRAVLGAEVVVDRPDGVTVVLAINAAPLPQETGSGGAIISFRDVTQRHRIERRERLLIEAGATLAGSLDYEETLTRVARAVVPVFADFCTVDLVDASARVRRVAIAAVEPRVEGALLAMADEYPPCWDSGLPAAVALREGRTVLLGRADAGRLTAHALDARHRTLLAEIRATSILAAPLIARESRVGALTFGFADSRRCYDAEDRRLGEEIARRAALAIENAQLYERAEASSRAKSDFIGVMSHEFRTPLTAIVGYADLLDSGISGELNERQRQQIERIRASAWHLTQLVDEVLTYSRIEAGRERVVSEPVDLSALAARAAALVQPAAEARGLILRTEITPGLIRSTDPHKIRQILLNLLSNAIKFTDAGSVTLRLDADASGIRFEVEDTGIGIAPEHIDRVFEAFWQVDQGTTRTHGGTGLGLTVSRRLARLLQSELRVDSRPGQGSRFQLIMALPEPTDSDSHIG